MTKRLLAKSVQFAEKLKRRLEKEAQILVGYLLPVLTREAVGYPSVTYLVEIEL